jgi:hypothetical protein
MRVEGKIRLRPIKGNSYINKLYLKENIHSSNFVNFSGKIRKIY